MKKLKSLLFFAVLLMCTLMLFACDSAGSNKSEETTAGHEHVIVVDEAVAPTCSENGLTEGSHCSVCSEIIKAQEVVEKLAHTEAIDDAVAATCSETGLTEGKHCRECGKILVAQETVSKVDHTIVIEYPVSATCQQIGMSEGKYCSACGEVVVEKKSLGYGPCVAENGICQICGEIKDICLALKYYLNTKGTCNEKGYMQYVTNLSLESGGTTYYSIEETEDDKKFTFLFLMDTSETDSVLIMEYVYGEETQNISYIYEYLYHQINATATINIDTFNKNNPYVFSFECSSSSSSISTSIKNIMGKELCALLDGLNLIFDYAWDTNISVKDLGFTNYINSEE